MHTRGLRKNDYASTTKYKIMCIFGDTYIMYMFDRLLLIDLFHFSYAFPSSALVFLPNIVQRNKMLSLTLYGNMNYEISICMTKLPVAPFTNMV